MVFMSVLLACGQPVLSQAKAPLKVQTTFYPVYYLATRIAGDQAEVSMLLDKGQDAHDYDITAKDTASVKAADVFIYQDDQMEFFVKDLLGLIDTNKTRVVKATEGLTLLGQEASDHDADAHGHGSDAVDHDASEEHSHTVATDAPAVDHDHDHDHDHAHHTDGAGHEGHHHDYDPHTWLDPQIYARQAENIKQALIAADPDNQAIYEKNATTLIDELHQLDAEFKEALADKKGQDMVVQHAAFGYLAHAYGLNQVPIAGLSTTQEPGAEALAKLQDYVKAHHVKTIYVDPASNDAIAKTVAEATGAQLLPLSTLEVVTKEQIKNGEDYLSLMRQNLASLKQSQ